MSHRQRDCTCGACVALGRVASVVVDEDTTEEHRTYIAKVLERSYTNILERGLELLKQERRATEASSSGVERHATPGAEVEEKEVKEEEAGVESHATPGTVPAEPPAGASGPVKEEKSEVEEEAPKKRKRRKRRPKAEEEELARDEELPEEKAEDTGVAGKEETEAPSETPGCSSTGVSQIEKDHRQPLPRKSPKPSANPAISLKEKKKKEDNAPTVKEGPRLKLRPKAKVTQRRSRSRSRGQEKEKKRRRSPSPTDYLAGGDRGVSSTTPAEAERGEGEEERPPGDWEERPPVVRRPRSPDHPPPLPRRPTRGQLWIGPIRAHKNKPPPKKNKGLKKERKNERYWERRRQQAWEERQQAYRRYYRR